MDRSSRQQINKETVALNDTLDQMYLTDKYRTFYQKLQNTDSFQMEHGTISRIVHTLGYKTSLNKFRKIEISSIFSDHNVMKLEINYKKKTQKTSTHGG